MGKYVCFMTKGIQGVTNSLTVTAFHLLITNVKYIISIQVILSLNSNSLTLFSGVSKLKEAQLVELSLTQKLISLCPEEYKCSTAIYEYSKTPEM